MQPPSFNVLSISFWVCRLHIFLFFFELTEKLSRTDLSVSVAFWTSAVIDVSQKLNLRADILSSISGSFNLLSIDWLFNRSNRCCCGLANIAGYIIYYTDDQNAVITDWERLEINNNLTTATLEGLEGGTFYYIRVQGRNGAGLGPISAFIPGETGLGKYLKRIEKRPGQVCLTRLYTVS